MCRIFSRAETVRDRPARRVLWVSRRVYSLSCLCLPVTRWDGTFPPQTEGLKGYKVQISSLSQLAKVHLSVHHSSLQAICLYLFINPNRSLFIAVILFHKVFAEAQTCWHTHTHTNTNTRTLTHKHAPFKHQYKIASRLWHFLKLLNVLRKWCDASGDMRGTWEINTKKKSPRVLPVLKCSLSLFSREEKQHANLKALFMDFHQIYGFIYYLQLRSVTNYEGAWPDAGLRGSCSLPASEKGL